MNKIFLIFVILLLSGCADSVSFQEAMDIQEVGFWYGVWHGICLPFSFIGSLFDDSIAIYAIYNNGNWYNFGYLIGTGVLGTSVNIRF